MTNNRCNFFLRLVFSCALANVSFSSITYAQTDPTDAEKQKAINTLNYITDSLWRITNYNDNRILAMEYETIISNLNLNQIPNEELVFTIQSVMERITRTEIVEKEKEFIRRDFDEAVKAQLRDAFNQASQGVLNTRSSNRYKIAGRALLSATTAHFDYRSRVRQLRYEEEKAEWGLHKDLILDLDGRRQKLLATSWRLLDQYKIDDRWRLTETQIEWLNSTIKATDLEKRERELARKSEEYGHYPHYWYYRGSTQMELGRNDDALKSFNTFQGLSTGLLRKDKIALTVAMCKATLLDAKDHPGLLRECLDIIESQAEDSDWPALLFAAIHYAQLGFSDQSTQIISRLIDSEHYDAFESIDVLAILAPTLTDRAGNSRAAQIIEGLVKGQVASILHIAVLYGAISDAEIKSRLLEELLCIRAFAIPNSSWHPLKWFDDGELHAIFPLNYIESEDVSLELKVGDISNKITHSDVTWSEVSAYPEVEGQSLSSTLLHAQVPNAVSLPSQDESLDNIELVFQARRPAIANDRREEDSYVITIIFSAERGLQSEAENELLSLYNRQYSGLGIDSESEGFASSSLGKLLDTVKKYAGDERSDSEFIIFVPTHLSINGTDVGIPAED